MKTRRVIYDGRVQGVGFRYTCLDIARGHDISGSVRNLPDGTVELIACGEDAEVDAFLHEIEVDSAVAHHIKSRFEEPLAEFEGHGFRIVRG